jgi:hypothetical protein
MAEYSAATAIANWRNGMQGAFEGVEDVRIAADDDFETFVIGISAMVTGFHGSQTFAGVMPIWNSGFPTWTGCKKHRQELSLVQ